jgi:hypothetical protein
MFDRYGFDFERLFDQIRGPRLPDAEIFRLLNLVKTVYGPRMRLQGHLIETDLREAGLPMLHDGHRKPKDQRKISSQRFMKLNSEWAEVAYN